MTLRDLVMAGVVALAVYGGAKLCGGEATAFLSNVAIDDTLYYLMPARYLLAGSGFSFDGIHRTNGVQPLWAACAVGVVAAVRDPLLQVRVLCGLSGLLWLAAGLVLYRTFRGHAWSSLAATGFILTGFTWRIAFQGMENGLHALLFALLLGAALGSDRSPGWRRQIQIGLLAALFTLTRVEGVILVPLLLVALVAADPGRRRTERPVRNAWVAAAAFSLPVFVVVLGTLAASHAYFGEALPISGSVKRFNETRVLEPIHASSAEALWWHLEYVARLGGLVVWEPVGSRQGPDAAWLARGAFVGMAALGVATLTLRARVRPRPAWLLVGGAMAAFCAFHLGLLALLLPHYTAYGTWYFACEFAGLWIVAAVGVDAVVRAAARVIRHPRLGAACAASASSWLALAVLAANLRPLHAAVPAAVPIPASFVTGGRWINRHLPAGQRIAAISSGYLAHEADAHTVVNLDGLANDSEYFHEYMEKPRLAEYLRNRKIDYFADVGSIADLAAGIGSVNGGVPLSELRLVRWWLHDEHQAFCVWKLWPRVGERFPTDAVSRIQFDAAVLHRYRIADPGELGTLATSERVVTSIVPPTGELRHVVMPAETADRLPLARDTVLPELRFDTGVGAGLRLLGVDLPRTPIRPGDRLVITRYWELGADAANAPEGEVVMRLGERELHAARLCHGTLRASDWRAGRVVVETYAVTLPADVASGPHAVFLEVRLPGGTLLPHESGSQPLFIDNLEVY